MGELKEEGVVGKGRDECMEMNGERVEGNMGYCVIGIEGFGEE